MPVDRLDVINSALNMTGNAPVAVEDDGSDEWIKGYNAYAWALRYLEGEHGWKFGTAIEAINRTGDSTDDNYEDAFAKPQNALQIISVTVGGVPIDYRIVGNQILCTVGDTDVVEAKFFTSPDPSTWSNPFGHALSHFVMEGIYRADGESSDADKMKAAGEAYLARARTRGDQEEPARPRFISSLAASRRVRRG